MESAEFKEFGVAMLDYITNYLDNARERRVLPTVQPGYMRDLIPEEAPEHGESWQDIMKDIDRVIMPGVTHWHSPHFHAYFAAGNSYPSIVADMLSDAIGCIGFSWMASPACTELEVVCMDWLGKAIGLPDSFLAKESNGTGGGIIQGSASESCLVSLLSAKARAIRKEQAASEKSFDEHNFIGKLVCYTSDQAHSSIPRAAMLAGVKMRLIESDENFSMRGATLKAAILKDKAAGLIPFFAAATLGTTNCLGFDAIDEIGIVTREEGVWLHIDAAYSGSAFLCEEFRHYMNGIENVDSFNFNPHKWMLVNFDCSAMWVQNATDIVTAFNVDPLYLKHDNQGNAMDYRHWQIPLGRRFRSLKLWFVLRAYGLSGLREHIRGHVQLAHDFENFVESDPRFEIVAPVTMGLVCFRMKNRSNEENEHLLKNINMLGKIHLVPAESKGIYYLRFAVCSRLTVFNDIKFAWEAILEGADSLFSIQNMPKMTRRRSSYIEQIDILVQTDRRSNPRASILEMTLER